MKNKMKKMILSLCLTLSLVSALCYTPTANAAVGIASLFVPGGAGESLLSAMLIVFVYKKDLVPHREHTMNSFFHFKNDDEAITFDWLLMGFLLDDKQGQIPVFQEITPEMKDRLAITDKEARAWKIDLDTLNNERESFLADIAVHDPKTLNADVYRDTWNRYFTNLSPETEAVLTKMSTDIAEKE